MSQTARQRRRLPVPLRWLHAGDDLAQPVMAVNAPGAPLTPFNISPGRFFRPLGRRRVKACKPRRRNVECGPNLKSP